MILLFDEPIHKYTHKSMIPTISKLTDFVMKYKRIALTLFLIAFIPSYYFQSHVPIYYDISRALPETLESNIGKKKLEQDFGLTEPDGGGGIADHVEGLKDTHRGAGLPGGRIDAGDHGQHDGAAGIDGEFNSSCLKIAA